MGVGVGESLKELLMRVDVGSSADTDNGRD